MISEKDLNSAIAEMQGQRRPDANTCIKLASYYTIRNELFPEQKPDQKPAYSFAAPPTENYTSDTEFGAVVETMDPTEALRRIDAVMSDLYVINPPLYRRILRELEAENK